MGAGRTGLRQVLTSSYLLALALLLIGGIANLASMSIGQTIVQLRAAPADRGRVVGLYGVSANGLRAGSGFTVGILGAAVGIHWSLGLSSVALCLGTLAAGIYARPPPRPRPQRTETGDSLRQGALDPGFHGVPAGPAIRPGGADGCHHLALDTGQGANWAAGGCPVSPRHGFCIIDGCLNSRSGRG